MAESTVPSTNARPQLSSFQQTRQTLFSSYGSMGSLSPTISDFTFDTSARLYYFGSVSPSDPESILMLDTGSGADMETAHPVQVLEPDCALHDVDRNWTPEQVSGFLSVYCVSNCVVCRNCYSRERG